jgi:hypothetical protein
MDPTEKIARRAYELWEAEGRPDGRHHEHWLQAEQELGLEAPEPADPHPGMMGDGTEEQNLGQPGNPGSRITAEEVESAFGAGSQH